MNKLTQLPERLDLSFVRGDSFLLDIKVKDDNENLIDFQNWNSEKLQVRNLESSGGNLVEEYVTGNGLITTLNGRVKVEFTSTQTSGWIKDTLQYQLEGIDGNGRKRTIIEGDIELLDNIAK